MPMKQPPHPGLSVRHDCLEPLGLSVTEGARVLGVTRQALNNLVTGRAGISPEMAVRLDKAFGGTAEGWLALQTAFDLAQIRKKAASIAVKRYVAKADLEPAGVR
ncbi:MAG: HigA family addiction module antidote protein [Nitrospirae bacterium]|nr:HigA family addiction module antidote protein [Nitrospirota bacterium]